ncbi:hypothetical protein ZEAMMB73_Zm00001d044740 [Zea mays]|uniref:Uncharacterized protein n=1 Tax=Zea mays TaxID=4577 RepID=A0A1D6NR47_MAIZE|nr:hypothetical protein ZEAMMB73_Zm00001d044740 [Zea mays]
MPREESGTARQSSVGGRGRMEQQPHMFCSNDTVAPRFQTVAGLGSAAAAKESASSSSNSRRRRPPGHTRPPRTWPPDTLRGCPPMDLLQQVLLHPRACIKWQGFYQQSTHM